MDLWRRLPDSRPCSASLEHWRSGGNVCHSDPTVACTQRAELMPLWTWPCMHSFTRMARESGRCIWELAQVCMLHVDQVHCTLEVAAAAVRLGELTWRMGFVRSVPSTAQDLQVRSWVCQSPRECPLCTPPAHMPHFCLISTDARHPVWQWHQSIDPGTSLTLMEWGIIAPAQAVAVTVSERRPGAVGSTFISRYLSSGILSRVEVISTSIRSMRTTWHRMLSGSCMPVPCVVSDRSGRTWC